MSEDEMSFRTYIKRVQAMKIAEIHQVMRPCPHTFVGPGVLSKELVETYVLVSAPDKGASEPVSVHVSADYQVEHKPQLGGYYVRCQDGSESFSSPETFESGYTALEE